MLALEKKDRKNQKTAAMKDSSSKQLFQKGLVFVTMERLRSSQDIRSCSNFWTPSLCLQSNLNELIASVSMQNFITETPLLKLYKFTNLEDFYRVYKPRTNCL